MKKIEVSDQLFTSGRFVAGVREIVRVVKMSEHDDYDTKAAYIRSIGGAVVTVEGALGEELKTNEEFPFAMVSTQMFGISPVTVRSVLLFNSDCREGDPPVEVIDEAFFDKRFATYVQPVEEVMHEEKVDETTSILNKLASGGALTDEESAIIIARLQGA